MNLAFLTAVWQYNGVCDSNDNIVSSEVMRLVSRQALKMPHSSREPQDRHLAVQDASVWVTGNQGADPDDFPTQMGKQY